MNSPRCRLALAEIHPFFRFQEAVSGDTAKFNSGREGRNMGDATAEYSISQVIEVHGDALLDEAKSELQAFLAALGVEVPSERIDGDFDIDATQLDVRVIATDPNGRRVVVNGQPVGITVLRFDIIQLGERFIDCDVAW